MAPEPQGRLAFIRSDRCKGRRDLSGPGGGRNSSAVKADGRISLLSAQAQGRPPPRRHHRLGASRYGGDPVRALEPQPHGGRDRDALAFSAAQRHGVRSGGQDRHVPDRHRAAAARAHGTMGLAAEAPRRGDRGGAQAEAAPKGPYSRGSRSVIAAGVIASMWPVAALSRERKWTWILSSGLMKIPPCFSE